MIKVFARVYETANSVLKTRLSMRQKLLLPGKSASNTRGPRYLDRELRGLETTANL